MEAGLGVLEARLGVLEARLGVLEAGLSVFEARHRLLEAGLGVSERWGAKIVGFHMFFKVFGGVVSRARVGGPSPGGLAPTP